VIGKIRKSKADRLALPIFLWDVASDMRDTDFAAGSIIAVAFLRCPMTLRSRVARATLVILSICLFGVWAVADQNPQSLPSGPAASSATVPATEPEKAPAAMPTVPMTTAPMTKETRFNVIRSLNAELAYVRTAFPMGEKGLRLKDGVISPSGEALQSMLAAFGPSVKPGDQVRISSVVIHDKSIVFEINGGPRKKTKWYQRISIAGAGGEVPVAPSDQDANARGSYVELQFDHRVPDLSPAELKTLLRPVFDFDAKSAIESYLETVPPKVKEAIQKHEVLVGMNREMVTYSKGRAEKKIREKDGDIEYEEWIYGEPPKDVEFVRLVGDEVVQMKTMKIDGEKIIRTKKEVDIGPSKESVAAAARPSEKPSDAPTHRPTLKRPGEDEAGPDAIPGQSPCQSTTRPRSSPPGGSPSPDPPNFQPGT